MHEQRTSILKDKSILAIFLKGIKFNSTLRNNWKLLFEVNFNRNSTKTIRLFTLDFYEVIVLTYYLIEILSSVAWCGCQNLERFLDSPKF